MATVLGPARFWTLLLLLLVWPLPTAQAFEWISALDEQRVVRKGDWKPDRFRFAAQPHLQTAEDRAHLLAWPSGWADTTFLPMVLPIWATWSS